ncbi:MFS transporter [Pseudomonas sp. H9]|uniref:MFS transporter n=1 Tax=Pseudomonas sp. H9 TaxID=483968 RepID=UPI001057D9A7|nr:MFS transporter [Pseudomonas sp. H9]TDF77664.1 MFS transporter [Pseudomonas sp. H9]
MTENDYLLAWGLYALAALGCLAVGFRLTRWMWRWLREPLRVLMAVLLFTPTIIDPVKDKFAPAIAITALDLLFKVGNNALRAAADLAMYGMIAFALYGLFVVLRWPLEKRAKARREQAEAAAQRDNEHAVAGESFGADSRDRYRDPPPASQGGNRPRVEPRL